VSPVVAGWEKNEDLLIANDAVGRYDVLAGDPAGKLVRLTTVFHADSAIDFCEQIAPLADWFDADEWAAPLAASKPGDWAAPPNLVAAVAGIAHEIMVQDIARSQAEIDRLRQLALEARRRDCAEDQPLGTVFSRRASGGRGKGRAVMSEKAMTKGEREDLQRLIRQREKVLKSAATQRSAELLAEFEQQLASIYCYDRDEIWSKAAELADKAGAEAQAMVAERCRELGIPEKFAPGLHWYWTGRGENCGQRERQASCLAEKLCAANELITMILRQMKPDPPARTFLLAAGPRSGRGRRQCRVCKPRPAAASR
jgi:hypothetical protein